MAPLALAFEAAGHQVAVATDPGFAPHVRAIGFEAFPAGIDMPVAMAKLYRAVPNWREVPPWEQVKYIYPGVFGGVRIEPMLADLERIIPEWRPDLLIHDSAELTGAIAAESAGIAHAEHAFGVIRPWALSDRPTETVEAVSRRLGLRDPHLSAISGELYLDPCPPALQLPAARDVPLRLPIRP